MPLQAKTTITLGQYNPQKLTPKAQTGNIGIHNVTYILHEMKDLGKIAPT